MKDLKDTIFGKFFEEHENDKKNEEEIPIEIAPIQKKSNIEAIVEKKQNSQISEQYIIINEPEDIDQILKYNNLSRQYFAKCPDSDREAYMKFQVLLKSATCLKALYLCIGGNGGKYGCGALHEFIIWQAENSKK
jgi:hypothetical protein